MHLLAATASTLVLLAYLGLVTAPAGSQDLPAIGTTLIQTPAAADSGQPQLSVSTRGVLLSWIERTGSETTLKFSERTSTGWTAARSVASGSNWFINWADVPSVVRLDDATLVGHWLQKSGAGTYAYDVRLSYSRDDGKSWSSPFTPHDDGTRTEHGFASLFQMPGAGLGLVWLDGRNMKGNEHAAAEDTSPGPTGNDMSLRFGSYTRDWKPSAETALDLRVCECCPTAVAVTSEGPIVAYRDRSADETRDIYIARFEKGQWSPPKAPHAEGWRVNACPVNGPSLSARGKKVALAWFSAIGDRPVAYAALSSDAGRTFTPPVRLDDQASLGRVDVELLADGSALAGYIEFADQKAQFRVRRIKADGSRSEASSVAAVAGNRSSGYPRMALHGGELVFAWTDRESGSQVKTAVAPVPR
ncbi:MAG: sialidase family protein [Vicinamibacterales bacterium]